MPWRHQHCVEAHREAGHFVVAGQPCGGGAGDAAPLMGRDRFGGIGTGAARLDLNEGDDAAAADDEVYFTGVNAKATGENPVALGAQQPGRHRFGTVTAAFGGVARRGHGFPGPASCASARARA